MSWLSSFVNNAAGWGGEDPLAVQQRQQAAAAAAARQQQEAQAAAELASQQATAQAAAPTPPAYSGPTAEAKLQALLPGGFENTLIPGSVADPYIASAQSGGRSAAQALIDSMFKRGTVSGSGRSLGLNALTSQDPTVKAKLAGISNTLLENERAKLRGIAGEGYGAAAGQSGETFDPSPYKSRTDAEASAFLGGFPASFTGAVGDVGGLYDTSSLGSSTGAAAGPRNLQFDPYAAEGGALSTGLDEGAGPKQKKRTTAVF